MAEFDTKKDPTPAFEEWYKAEGVYLLGAPPSDPDFLRRASVPPSTLNKEAPRWEYANQNTHLMHQSFAAGVQSNNHGAAIMRLAQLVEETKKELQTAQCNYESAEEELEATRDNLSDVEADLREEETLNAVLEDALETTRDTLSSTETALQDARDELSTAVSDLELCQHVLANKEKEIETLKTLLTKKGAEDGQ